MKTTNTTTNSAIFTAAHAMTRKTLKRYPSADYRVTFAAALKIAYFEANNSPREQWDALDGEAQYNALRRMVYRLKRTDGSPTKDGKPTAPVLDWTRDDDDLRAVAHEAFLRMNYYLDQEIPVQRALYRACRMAAQNTARKERRNASALKARTSTTENGDRIEEAYIIEHAAPNAEPIAPSPEAALIIVDKIERAAHDDIDRRIIAARAIGKSSSEIGTSLNISNRAVNKRIAAIKERYTAED